MTTATPNPTFQATMHDVLEGMRAKQVYGEPIEREGAIFLPAAKVRGGGGGGGDTEGNAGGGFGLTAKPAGMYVIRNGDAEWRPAMDVNRIVFGAQVVAIVALFALRSILKARYQAMGRR
jgi:uncharacterized spore protein YtfJ